MIVDHDHHSRQIGLLVAASLTLGTMVAIALSVDLWLALAGA